MAAVSLNAAAILIRPDRDDAEYLELATKYAPSVAIAPVDAEGVLIAPSWVLTSARVARALDGKKNVTIDGKSYKLKSVHPHPTADIGLLFLGSGYRHGDLDFEAARLYRADDEGGKTVVIVGHGANGKIGSPLAREIGPQEARGSEHHRPAREREFDLGIKAADLASDLQGALGAGDFGGPAFVKQARACWWRESRRRPTANGRPTFASRFSFRGSCRRWWTPRAGTWTNSSTAPGAARRCQARIPRPPSRE